jgi:hypothetical protein
VVHVLALCGLGEAEGDLAEVGWSGRHGALLVLGESLETIEK